MSLFSMLYYVMMMHLVALFKIATADDPSST